MSENTGTTGTTLPDPTMPITSRTELLAFERAYPGTLYCDRVSDCFKFIQPGAESVERRSLDDVITACDTDGGSRGFNASLGWISFSANVVDGFLGSPAAPERDAAQAPAPEGYVSKEAVAELMRREALKNDWCGQHHEVLTDLGIVPLGVEREFEITITVKGTLTRDTYLRGWASQSADYIAQAVRGSTTATTETEALARRLGLRDILTAAALTERLRAHIGTDYNPAITEITTNVKGSDPIPLPS